MALPMPIATPQADEVPTARTGATPSQVNSGTLMLPHGAGKDTTVSDFEEDVHPYSVDNSYRCFHVRLDALPAKVAGKKLIARIIANTGTKLLGYRGYGMNYNETAAPDFGPVDLDISSYDGSQAGKPSLFYPFNTTLIEIILNREPMPPVDIFTF